MKAPTKIGKYEIIDVIGRGGMGVVYKATDPLLDRLVAIKMMTIGYAEDPNVLKRFYREAQSTAGLQHPNIVTVYDLGDQDGNPYLVMQYLEGESLDAIISSRRPLSVLEKVQIILDTCRGLAYAHERGVIHRDIKPGNIMVSSKDGVKLVDFGIAHIASKTLTRTGEFMGSIHYMSPEQINGRPPVDPRTDIYSTGVVLYQLFTYALPFEGESFASTAIKILNDPPPPWDKFLTLYPKELESIVLRSLAKNREDRYRSADELALDLLQIHEQLKQETVVRYLHQAEAFIGKGDLRQAKDQLVQLLKLDQKHTGAIRLLRQVQQTLDKEHNAEQARQLRAKAEESYAHGEFEAALLYLDQAVALDTTNLELPKFREVVKEGRLKAEQLHRALRRAETAHERGDLDAAKQAVEEALEINSNDTQAKGLYRIIHRDWVERSRQRQLEVLLDSARQEVNARNFTAALNILKQAETIDPQAAQVRALLEEVTASRERERQRKELERVNREVEEALNRDDYETASDSLEAGLQQFPQERSLLQLKALAIRQRAAAERKQFVKEQIAAARQLLDANQVEAALKVLQTAVQKVPQEPQLETLLAMVQERVARDDQEQRRQGLDRVSREVQRALDREDYDAAFTKVQAGISEFGQQASLIQLKALVQKQRAAAERKVWVQQQVSSARQLLDASKSDEALALLRKALREVPGEPQLETLLTVLQERVAREEQGRRGEGLERINREIEEALSREDYTAASSLADEGLKQFPKDQGLAQLKSLVQRQRAAAERSLLVRGQIANTRKLLDAGQAREALTFLQRAIEKFPEEPQLETLLTMVQDRVSREEVDQAKARSIQQARDALNRRAYGEAVQILEGAQVRFLHSPEIDDILRFAREQEAKENERKAAESAIRRAQQWISENQYGRAIQLLEATLEKSPNEQLRMILEEARRRSEDYHRDLRAVIAKARQFLEEGSPAKAVALLEAQPNSYRSDEEFARILKEARNLPQPQPALPSDQLATVMMDGSPAPAEAPTVATSGVLAAPLPTLQPEPKVARKITGPPPKRKAIAIAVVAAAAALFAVGVVWKLAPTSPPVGTLVVQTNEPNVAVLVDNASKGETGDAKELRVPGVRAGSHEVRVQKDGYDVQPASQQVNVLKNKEVPVQFALNEIPKPKSPVIVDTGSLLVQTTTANRVNLDGVDLFVDNVDQGVTGNDGKRKISQLAVGPHEVRIRKSGYNQLPARTVNISKNKEEKLLFTLTEIIGPPTYLEIKAPAGAEVKLDGEHYDIVPPEGLLRVQIVKPSEQHRVDVNLDGYTPWSSPPKTVKPGQTLPLTADMRPFPPTTTSFKVNPDSISPGQKATLIWQTKYANEVTIDGIGTRKPNDSAEVSPPQTTTYKLTAKGPGGDARPEVVTLTVVPLSKATISVPLQANPSTIHTGETSTLSWTTQNAASVSIEPGVGQVGPSGSQTVRPSGTTDYLLTAKGQDGSTITSTVHVAVTSSPEPPSPACSEAAAASAAIDRLETAYEDMDEGELRNAWPTVPKSEIDRLKQLLHTPDLKTFKEKFINRQPSCAPDVVTVTCDQSGGYNLKGKHVTLPTVHVTITLKKTANGWVVDRK